jgi:hypothetical protein
MPIAPPDRLPSTTSTAANRGAPSNLATRAGSPAAAPSPFAQLLTAFGHEAERGEATIRGVLQGSLAAREYGPSALLALQAGIYRYGETVDLASKLVDKAGSDLRTVLQGQ